MSRAALLSLAICVLALSACESPTSGLDAHDLTVAAQQIGSLAGEAEWLAQQLRAGSCTSNYAWVHQQAIAEDAVKVSRDIATRPTPAPLQARRESLAALDARLQAQLTRIAPASGRAEELEALQRDFRLLARQALAPDSER